MAQPQAVSSFYNYPIWSAIDYFKPQDVNVKYKQHGDQFLPLFMILRSMGRERMISNTTWFGFEDQEIHVTIHAFGGVGDPGAGNPGTLVLDASLSDVDSQGYTYLRERDIIRTPNGTNAYVTNMIQVSPTQVSFTITPLNINLSIGAIPAGQEMAIISGASAEGTGPVAPATRRSYRKDFYLQTIKEHIAIEGGTLSDEVYPKFMEDGKTIIGVYSEAVDDLEYRLNLKINGAHWTGQENSNGLYQVGGGGGNNTVWTTGGLLPAAAQYGMTYPTGGVFPLSYFDDLTTYLTQQRVQSEYMMFMHGIALGNAINNTLYAANLNTAVDYTMISKSLYSDNKDLAMSISFSQYMHNTGYKFLFRRMDDFSNPTTFGVPAYGFDQTGLIMPLNKFKDPESGAIQNNIEFVYKEMGKYSRRYKMWTISGAGEQELQLTANDWTDTYAQATTGMQIFKANQFILLNR